MLRKWAERQADSTERAKLQSALLDAQLVSLADKRLSIAEANTSLYSTSITPVVCEISLIQHAENDRQSTQQNEYSQGPTCFEERWSSQTQQEFDAILKKIAQSLYKKSDIDNLGSALGFGPAEIGRCTDENDKQGGNYMGTLAMLRTWGKLQTDSTNRKNLRIALVAAGLVNLAEAYTPDDIDSMVYSPIPVDTESSTDHLRVKDSNTGREELKEEIKELRGEVLAYEPGEASVHPKRVEFPENLYIGLFGRTGCGKTSLINSLKYATHGRLRRAKWLQVATQEKAGGHTMFRKIADITKRIFVIDNRGFDGLSTDRATAELLGQLAGERGYGSKVEWQEDGDEDKAELDFVEQNKGHKLGCVVFVFR
ncbi:uncharacterized protein LOC135155133 isoform X2 [Lytechinus pictus]|uniref:uncharacterized protein LOC135155133 isoform X2 n=1 Tax=Lytechinus pictus TaxID=7653 RepID=UPI0030B9BE37